MPSSIVCVWNISELASVSLKVEFNRPAGMVKRQADTLTYTAFFSKDILGYND